MAVCTLDAGPVSGTWQRPVGRIPAQPAHKHFPNVAVCYYSNNHQTIMMARGYVFQLLLSEAKYGRFWFSRRRSFLEFGTISDGKNFPQVSLPLAYQVSSSFESSANNVAFVSSHSWSFGYRSLSLPMVNTNVLFCRT